MRTVAKKEVKMFLLFLQMIGIITIGSGKRKSDKPEEKVLDGNLPRIISMSPF